MGVLLSFEADPQGASEADRRSGMDTNVYNREHGLNFSSFAGKPVYSGFLAETHISDLCLYVPGHPVLRSFDFGYHHPAVSYYQWFGHSLWALGELMGEDVTLDRFVQDFVRPYEQSIFPEDTKYIDFGDPAGKQQNDKSDFTSFGILANHGIFPRWRKSEINEGLTLVRRQLALPNGYLIHPRCRLLIQGFKGGYRYPEPTKGTPSPQFPLKDGYFDHLQDTQRYMAINTIKIRNPPPPRPKAEDDPPLWAEAMRGKSAVAEGSYKGWE